MLSAIGSLHVMGTISLVLFIEMRIIRLHHKAARCHNDSWSVLCTPLSYFYFEN